MPRRAPTIAAHAALAALAIVACLVFGSSFTTVAAIVVALAGGGVCLHVLTRAEADRASAALDDANARGASLSASLAAARRQMESLIQSMDGGVVILDDEQRILSLNHAAESLLGVTSRSASGRLLQEIVRQPELNRFVADASDEARSEVEVALSGRPDRRVRATRRPLHDENGRFFGLLIVLTDVTHLRRLESVRSDFASNVSHELRTPITNIKGYVETLLDMNPAADPDQARQFLQIVARNADRLGAIVEDMLMLTQLERPDTRDALHVDHARIAPILEAVQSALEAEASRKSIRVECHADDDLAAMVNQPLVEQALTNLLANAIRYSPVGTRVVMQAKGAGGEVVLSVTDQGPGIAEEHLPRLFERFYRVDKARSREQGGTGLGLAIAKHIVHLHQGRIEVDSTPGKGSTFRIILPAP